jgi:ketosteroid isomerase-like protein
MNTEAEAVELANHELYAAVEAADLGRMAEVWLDGPHAETVVCVHPGWPAIQGREEVLRSWTAIMANTPYIQFFLTDVEVSVLETTASVTCTENVLTADETTGPDSFGGAKAVATNVFVRTDAGWRLWIHHASPVLSGDNHEDA